MADSIAGTDLPEIALPLLPPLAATEHFTGYNALHSTIIVAIGSLTLFLNNGFMLIGISIFDPMMMKRLGVSVGVLKFGDTITFMTVAVAAPLAGYLIDKLGPRPLFAVGMSLMGIGLLLYPIARTLVVVYLDHVLFGLCLVLCGAFACLIVVSEATSGRRGLAIGVLLATASLGSAVSPSVFTLLGRLYGWQAALDVVGLAAFAILPLIFLFVPRRLQRSSRPGPGLAEAATLGIALRSHNFWFLGIVAGISYLASIGIATNMVLFLNGDLHLHLPTIDLMMIVLFSLILVSQLCMGLLCDHLDRRVMHVGCIVVMALGCLGLGSGHLALVWPAIVLFAIGWGGNYVLLQFLLTHLFAGPSVGRIVGVIGMVEALGGSLGPVIVGGSDDATGNYGLAFIALAVALLLAAAIAARIGKIESIPAPR